MRTSARSHQLRLILLASCFMAFTRSVELTAASSPRKPENLSTTVVINRLGIRVRDAFLNDSLGAVSPLRCATGKLKPTSQDSFGSEGFGDGYCRLKGESRVPAIASLQPGSSLPLDLLNDVRGADIALLLALNNTPVRGDVKR